MFEKIPLLQVHDARLTRYEYFVIHCTATKSSMTNVDAAWVDKVHKNRGWRGCGYHAVITRKGEWEAHDAGFPARPYGEQGAHVKGFNDRAFGVALAGGLDEAGYISVPDRSSDPRFPAQFTEYQMRRLELGLMIFLGRRAGLPMTKVVGHRDLLERRTKECPTFDVSEWLTSGWMPKWALKRCHGG